jgi:hypothetical protein
MLLPWSSVVGLRMAVHITPDAVFQARWPGPACAAAARVCLGRPAAHMWWLCLLQQLLPVLLQTCFTEVGVRRGSQRCSLCVYVAPLVG